MRGRPKNWARHQHYKGRRPPWIKLHRSILDDPDWGCLAMASKALLPQIWLLASESDDGEIDLDPGALAWRLRCAVDDVRPAVAELAGRGWLEITGTCDADQHDASTMLAERAHGASNLPPQRQSRDRVESESDQSQSAIQTAPSGSRKPENQTPSEPSIEPAQRLIESAKQLEQWGFSKYGQLTGTNWARLRSLLPADREELDAAAATGGNSWGYVAKVLISMRERASEQVPQATQRKAPKAKHPAIERALEHHRAGHCSLSPDAHDQREIVHRADSEGIDWALLEQANRESDCDTGHWETLWRVYDRLRNAPVAHGNRPRIDAGAKDDQSTADESRKRPTGGIGVSNVAG